MKKKFILANFLLFFIFSISYSQTIYHFQYQFPASVDTGIYNAFFVRNDNGSGFIRIKYNPVGTEEMRMVELNMQEEYVINTEGVIDTGKIIYKTSTPYFKVGIRDSAFIPPVFWFSRKAGNNYYEPAEVSLSENKSEKNMGIFLVSEYIQKPDLKKSFVLQFFNQDESLFQNLFEISSRGVTGRDRNVKIFLLIVANTKDSAIGSTCRFDMERAEQTYQDLADFLEIPIIKTSIYGDNYNKKNIENAIRNLNPGKEDIVIFYYSGHGFRKKTDNRRFPYLDFRANPREDYKIYSMNVEDIYDEIVKKNARFNLVISDCCNNDPASTNAIGNPIPNGRRAGFDWSEDNCMGLFMNPVRQSVLATSADIGQLASGNNNFGGFFSHYFKTSMEDHFGIFKTNVSWYQVLQDAKSQTIFKAEHTICSQPSNPSNRCKQYPFYRIK